MTRIILLSVDPVSSTFNLNPTTVFGVLAGLLLGAVIALWIKLGKNEETTSTQAKEHKSDYEKLLRENLEALKAMDQSFRGIEGTLKGVGKDTLRELGGLQDQLKSGHDAITRQIASLESSLNTHVNPRQGQ